MLKNDPFFYLFQVLLITVHEMESQQRGAAFVHVVGFQVVVVENLKHMGPAESQHKFLLKPVALVSALQIGAYLPVFGRIGVDVGVEEQHRYHIPGDALHRIDPRLDMLFLAMPILWKGTLQQYAGRLHRLFKTNKKFGSMIM